VGFIVTQYLVGIDAVVSAICEFHVNIAQRHNGWVDLKQTWHI